MEYAIIPAFAFFLAWLLVFVVAVIARLSRVIHAHLFGALIIGISCVSVINVLLSGRSLQHSGFGLEITQDLDVGSTIVGKVLLAGMLSISAAICSNGLFAGLIGNFSHDRYNPSADRRIRELTYSFAAYFIAFSVLPVAFAPRFEFHVNLVYPFFVWIALFLSLRGAGTDPVRSVRIALAVVIVSSLLAAALVPSLAVQPSYVSLIPSLDFRLWGTTPSANTLGSVASIFVILQLAEKSKRIALHNLLTACGVLALVLSQSKTAIVGTLLGLFALGAWRALFPNASESAHGVARRILGVFIVFLCAATLVIVVWIAVADSAVSSTIVRRLDPTAVEHVSNLTGRLQIWSFALERGLEAPWFGQGLSMWDVETRLSTRLTAASHAHNLYLQTFSRSGIIGVFTLMIFLMLLLRLVIAGARPSGGTTVALFGLFLVRSLTEVPLQPNSVMGGESLTFVAMTVYIIDRSLRSAAPRLSGLTSIDQQAWPSISGGRDFCGTVHDGRRS